MESDLSTDAVGVPARIEAEHEHSPQNQSEQSQTDTFSDPSYPVQIRESHVTACPNETLDSASDLIEISFDPVRIRDDSDHSNDLQTLSETDLINNSSDPGPNFEDNPIGMFEKSNADHVADLVSDQFKPVTDIKLKSDGESIEMNTSDGRRHLSNTNSVLTSSTRRQINFPPEPPLEWRLNELIDDIALSIEPQELGRIKLMFTGPKGIGKKVLEQCDTFLKLFIVLKERGYISRDNILYLNKILNILDRQDLILRAARYCRDEGDVTHYYSVQGKHDSGSRDIKIHVVTDVSNCDQESIERLRNIVARITCAPPEVVIIAAVEPGSSLLITLTMPNMYVDVLKQLLEEKVPLRRLAVIEADKIIIDNVRYDISGQCTELCITEQNKEIMNVYEQLEDKRRELASIEIAYLKFSEEMNNVKVQLNKAETIVQTVDHLERVNDELSTTCAMLQSMHVTSERTEAELDKFQLLLEEATNKEQDMGLIKEIVKSNTEIVASYHRYANETEREKQRIKYKLRRNAEVWLRHELLSKIKTAEEILFIKYRHHTLDIAPTLNMKKTQLVNAISGKLTSKEKSILIRRFTWPKNDVIKACIDADENLLLLGLECKEAERTQEQIDTGKFLELCGREVGRDLLHMYTELDKKENEETKTKDLKKQQTQQLEFPIDYILEGKFYRFSADFF